MKTAFLLRSAFVLALATAALAASAQNLVQNPGFETGLLAPWAGNNVAVSAGVSHTGTYSGDVNSGGEFIPSTLFQSLATAPGAYTVSFWLRSLSTENATTTVNFGSTRLLSLLNPPSFDYTFYSFNVMTATATTAISFTQTSANRIIRVDDVSVTPVPEPSAFAALGLGLGLGVVAVLRRL